LQVSILRKLSGRYLCSFYLIPGTYSTRKTEHDDYHLRGSLTFADIRIYTPVALSVQGIQDLWYPGFPVQRGVL